MYQLLFADTATLYALGQRARAACITFSNQDLPPGSTPDRGRIGFEVDQVSGRAHLYVDRGVMYRGNRQAIAAWLNAGQMIFSSFDDLVTWMRTELAAAYQETPTLTYQTAYTRSYAPVTAGSTVVAPDFAAPMPAALGAAFVLTPIIEQRLKTVLAVAQAAQLPVQHSFNAPLFTGTVTIPSAERDWLLMPLSEDPAYGQKDGYPMPRDVVETLRRLEAAQVEVDSLYVAHELPKSAGLLPGQVDRTALLTPPVSSKAQERAASFGTVATNLVKAAFAPLFLAGVAGAALGTGAAIATGALIGLDPLLLGVITDPRYGLRPGAPAAWVSLACWRWE